MPSPRIALFAAIPIVAACATPKLPDATTAWREADEQCLAGRRTSCKAAGAGYEQDPSTAELAADRYLRACSPRDAGSTCRDVDRLAKDPGLPASSDARASHGARFAAEAASQVKERKQYDRLRPDQAPPDVSPAELENGAAWIARRAARQEEIEGIYEELRASGAGQ